MLSFQGNILIIGYGAVAQCSLPLILRHSTIVPHQIKIIDPLDKSDVLTSLLNQGTQFSIQAITEDNYDAVLSAYLSAGDICIDLANEVDTVDVLTWCQENKVLYLNTCLNNWPGQKPDRLYDLYQAVLQVITKHTKGVTAILAHGANPGLISSFTKHALIDMAEYLLMSLDMQDILKNALYYEHFDSIAYYAGIKAIHLTDKDTQSTSNTISKKGFLNTWSIPEFINECTSKIEFAWGSHEYQIPPDCIIQNGNIFFSRIALHSTFKSWIPDAEFIGMVLPHEETFSIADYLMIDNDETFYRPTVLFVYDPCLEAKKSLKNLNEFDVSDEQYVITNEIISGAEKLGSLLINGDLSWWTGTVLDIEESNRLLPHHNATVMQVAAGVLSGLTYMIRNQKIGICFPEQLDHHEILATAKPFLGEFISRPVLWNMSKRCDFSSYLCDQ